MATHFIGRWGFIIAGVIFMLAALISMAGGRSMNVAFFVLGIAFLVIGGGIARRNRAAK